MNNDQPFASRRARLIESMGPGIAVIPTAPEVKRNRDSDYPYRFDSYFHYLSGFGEPEAVLVLVGGAQPRQILFCRDKDEEREIWDGYRLGYQAAREALGLDETFPIGALDEQMPRLLAGQPRLLYPAGADAGWDARVFGWLNQVRAMVRTGITAPATLTDVRSLLDEMRLIKDRHELATMRAAATISADAHVRAMRATAPGRMEYEIEAELLHEFRRRGSPFPAYSSIVAGGANACVLHYRENTARLRDGELLLIDAGCELDGYASDITRTFPVNGRFSGPQRDLYALVLESQHAAIEAVAPGRSWNDPHEAAVAVLARGFIDLGLCQGSVEAVIESGDYRRFYMHRTGHWLGLDVHDVGDYRAGVDWRPLVEGMVLTVEPGCYVRPGEGVPEAFWHIGIRIEDDVVVTPGGCEVITAGVPKDIAAIEALVGQALG
jgi:Xaa-Pro aminopeptidase